MKISGKLRLAIFLSAVWLLLALFLAVTDSRFNLIIFLVAGVLPVAFVWGVIWVYRGFATDKSIHVLSAAKHSEDFKTEDSVKSDSVPVSELEKGRLKTKSAGIAGWLILPALGIVLSPFWILATIISSYQEWMNIVELTTVQLQLISIAAISYIVSLPLSIIALILFFKKKKQAPYWMIVYYGVNVIFTGLEVLVTYHLGHKTGMDTDSLNNLLGSSLGGFSRACGIAIVWIPYFLLSKRVKRTFVK